MTDFTDHTDVLKGLNNSQGADDDNRQAGREAHLFIDKQDGQWEPYWWDLNKNRPRYTFDQTSPIIDQIAGEMEQADFGITIKPAGGDATKDDAMLLDGLVRNIENISNFKDIFNMAGRNMITAGLDGWQIVQELVDDDSFDQDLVIKPIANFIDSVWFWPFKKPDASDAPACVVLEAIPTDKYDETWPDGSGISVSTSNHSTAYFNKNESIIVGQLYYIEKVERVLFLMSDGRVLEDTPENLTVMDELAAEGVTILKTRKRNKNIVKSHLFDGSDWLKREQTTVFNQIPVIPTMANFKVFENKVLWRGVVSKLMDEQRVFNYAKSREIEEGALAPRGKYWGTKVQTAGHEDTIATLNTNADPFQHFNADPKLPGIPQFQPGGTTNPGLSAISADMSALIQQSAGLFDANMGDNPGLQSGVAIKRLQDKGDIGTIKYFSAQERAISRTCRILIDAIPPVYDTPRQERILKEDGSFDMVTLNDTVLDEETGRLVTVNDMSKGKYDVTCSSGPSFQNKQEETVAGIIEMITVDPSILATAGDILFNNITSPGMDQIGERLRLQIFNQGAIPFDQQTDEEKQQTQAAQAQPPPPDPLMVAAQAEADKAEAQKGKVIVEAQVAERKADREDFKARMDQQQQLFDQFMERQTAGSAEIATLAKTVKDLREGLGLDSIVGPGGLASIIQQVQLVLAAQSTRQ